jgi:predicted O-methyltransferase YrrM
VSPASVPVDPVLLHAMSWAVELGVPAVTPEAGALLRLLASVARARAVVEIGTGTGVSGLWLLSGMRPDGVLTSIDVEAEYQAMARQSFAAAGFATSRSRLIAGVSAEILPRLADGAYDLVFVDGDPAEYASGVSAAHRLLREGGVLVMHNALRSSVNDGAAAVDTSGGDGALGEGPYLGNADPYPDQVHALTRELVLYLRDAPEWVMAIVPIGAGLLCATKA